jgi:hypothetical protein
VVIDACADYNVIARERISTEVEDGMNKQEFETKTLNVLKGHAKELDHMETAITASSKAKANIPNLKDVLKELSETATECRQTLDHYDETDPLPDSVRLALVRVQEAVGSCASALVLHYATTVRD